MTPFSGNRTSDPPLSYPAAFCALILLYALTGVSNRIESVDGYLYAGAAEFLNFGDTHDPRSLLFHKLNKLLAAANAAAGRPFDTYALLCVPTVIAGALGVILMHRLLRRHLLLSPEASVTGAGLLAVSYGYWRYANEIEVYIPSICLVLGVVCLLCQRLQSEAADSRTFALPGIMAGFSVLYYQANALPLFIAMPALFLLSRRIGQFFVYAAAGCAVIAGGMLAAYGADQSGAASLQGFLTFLGRRSAEFPAPALELVSLARGASAILRDIISLNWLYGSDFGRDLITKYAAAHAYYHEGHFFAATQAPWLVRIAPFTFAAALAALTALVITRGLPAPRDWLARRPIVAFLITWLIVHAAVVISLDPTEMEVWIIALVPLWALFAFWISGDLPGKRRASLGIAAVLLLALHNYAGGLQFFSSGDSDLYRKQVAGILQTARSGDFVLFTGPYPPTIKPVRLLIENIRNRDRRAVDAGHFITPVYSDGDTAVIYRFDEHLITQIPLDDMLRAVRASGQRLIVPQETLNPRPVPEKFGGAERFRKLNALGARLSRTADRLYEDPVGAAYAVSPE